MQIPEQNKQLTCRHRTATSARTLFTDQVTNAAIHELLMQPSPCLPHQTGMQVTCSQAITTWLAPCEEAAHFSVSFHKNGRQSTAASNMRSVNDKEARFNSTIHQFKHTEQLYIVSETSHTCPGQQKRSSECSQKLHPVTTLPEDDNMASKSRWNNLCGALWFRCS